MASFTAKERKRFIRLIELTVEYGGIPSTHPLNDPVRHCTASCASATKIGETGTNIIGFIREFDSNLELKNTCKEAAQDIHNDAIGVALSGFVNSSANTPISDQCFQLCLTSVAQGDLIL